jgi:hypothetical protein
MAKNHYLHCCKIMATYLATILEGWINGWSLDELVGWSLDIEIGSRKIQRGCYRWEGEDFEQNMWGLKWGAIGNTLGEHIGNLKGTCWEQRKKKKKQFPAPSLSLKTKKKKNQSTLSACWVFGLDAQNFYFQNHSSPFFGLG